MYKVGEVKACFLILKAKKLAFPLCIFLGYTHERKSELDAVP